MLNEHSLPSPASALRPLPPPVCMAAKSQNGEKTTVAAALAAALPAACIEIETKNLIMHASRSRPRMEICERLSLVAAASGHAPPSPPHEVPCRASQCASRGAVPGVSVCEQGRRSGRLSTRAGAPCRASQYASRGSTSDGFITRIRRVASSEKASISTRSPPSSAPAASPMYTRTSSSVHPTPA